MMTSKVMTNNNGDDIHNYNGHLDNNHPDNDDAELLARPLLSRLMLVVTMRRLLCDCGTL